MNDDGLNAPVLFEEDDDRPIGRVLSRREMLVWFGGAGALLVAGAGMRRLASAQTGTPTPMPTPTPAPTLAPSAAGMPLPSCIVKPELAAGPFFVPTDLERSDIRSDPADERVVEGLPLHLTFNVARVTRTACAPLVGAVVDVWHCDARGRYSGVQDGNGDQRGELWLRGYQVTDKYGSAAFTTIYPGWYPGRTVHIHFKIRTDPASDTGYEFTSQLFFPDAINNRVHTTVVPYTRKGLPDTPNARDGIFRRSEDLLTLTLHEEADGSYSAIFGVGMDVG